MEKYLIAAGGFVIRDDGATIPPDPNNGDYAQYLEWVAAGNTAGTVQISAAQVMAQMAAAVQTILDDKARAYGYDSMMTAVTYADEPAVPKFQVEGLAFRAWRSLVWQTAHDNLADIQAGLKPFPALDEIAALVPPFPLDPVPTGA
jgi:hypothetical protein